MSYCVLKDCRYIHLVIDNNMQQNTLNLNALNENYNKAAHYIVRVKNIYDKNYQIIEIQLFTMTKATNWMRKINRKSLSKSLTSNEFHVIMRT